MQPNFDTIAWYLFSAYSNNTRTSCNIGLDNLLLLMLSHLKDILVRPAKLSSQDILRITPSQHSHRLDLNQHHVNMVCLRLTVLQSKLTSFTSSSTTSQHDTHFTRISCNTSSDSEHVIYTTTIGQIILYLIFWFSFSELDGSTVIEYLISTAQASSMGILLSLTTARQIHNIRPLAVVWDERCPLNSSIDLGGLYWVIQRWYCHELTHIIRELSNFSASGIEQQSVSRAVISINCLATAYNFILEHKSWIKTRLLANRMVPLTCGFACSNHKVHVSNTMTLSYTAN